MSRVLQVVGALNAGGVEALMVDVCRRAHKEHQFIFLCYIKTDQPYHYEQEVLALGAKIVRIPDNRTRHPVRFIRDIMRVIQQERIDVVHAHVDLSAAYAVIAGWFCGIQRRIAHSHNSVFSMPKAVQWFYKLGIRLFATDKVAVSSDAGRAMFGHARYTVMINGADVQKFAYAERHREEVRKRLGIAADDIVWLNVGRLSYQKNQSKLLHVFSEKSQTSSRPMSLIILGEGDLLLDLQEETRRLGIEEKVHFMGRVSDAYKYYSAADLFILTSRYEGLSVACIEAQANGVPCIMPANTSKESVVNKNVILTDDPVHADVLARVGDTAAIMRYDIDNVARRMTEMYTKKMKVGLLIDEFFGGAGTAYGGYGFLARKYVAKLIPSDDIEVEVLLGLNISRHRIFRSILGAFKSEHHVVDGVHVYRVPWLPFVRRRWLKKKGYDVYLSIELTGTCDYILKSDPEKRLVLWVQDPRPASAWRTIDKMQVIKDHSFYNQRLYDFVNASARAGRVTFISQGETLNPLAKELYGLPESTPIAYVPNPIDIDYNYTFNIQKKKKSVIFLGRLEAQKRCWLFCEIAKRMPEYEFYVIGQFFRYKKENQATLEPYMKGDIKNLHFVGHLDGDEKKRFIRESRLLLSTSVWEGIPISWLEALSFGTVIVSAFEREGLVEQFGEFVGEVEGDGFDKVEVFIPAIKKLMEEDELYLDKATKAIEYIRDRHSTDAFTENMRAVLRHEVERGQK